MIIDELKSTLINTTSKFRITQQAHEQSRKGLFNYRRELETLEKQRPEMLGRIAIGDVDATVHYQLTSWRKLCILM